MKNIIITGASGNMGYAVTQQLINSGYQIIAIDATPPRDSYKDNPAITTVQLDLADEQNVSDWIRDFDVPVDAAVLTVGGFAMGGFAETDVAQLRKMITLNFETAYHLVRGLLPGFNTRGKGQCILIGARPALDPGAGKDMIAYALSKSLVFSLGEMINAAATGNVHATVLVPSTIDTAANRKSMPDADFDKWVPAARIADTVDFLLGPAGSMLREPVIRIYNEA